MGCGFNIAELYDKMVGEQFMGQLSFEGDWLVWKLPNGVIIEVALAEWHPEAYIGTYCMDGSKKIQLAHWHPQEEDTYGDLLEINSGQIFCVKRKKKQFLCPNVPLIMHKNEWERFSEKRKGKYVILA